MIKQFINNQELEKNTANASKRALTTEQKMLIAQIVSILSPSLLGITRAQLTKTITLNLMNNHELNKSSCSYCFVSALETTINRILNLKCPNYFFKEYKK